MFLSKQTLKKAVKLLPIDFTKPWWQVAIDQKWLVAKLLFFGVPPQIFAHTIPFIIAYILKAPNMVEIALLFVVWVVLETSYAYSLQLNTQFQLQCIHSVYQNAHQHLLVIDPLYHIHRSSGTLIGKIERGARGYEDMLDAVTFQFFHTFLNLSVIIIATLFYAVWLSGVITCFFILIILVGYYLAHYHCLDWEKRFIQSDDTFRAHAVESLSQVQLIRTTFATDYMSHTLTKEIEHNMRVESGLWLSYTTAWWLLDMLYMSSFLALLGTLSWQIVHGTVSVTAALGLAIAYMQSTNSIRDVTKYFRVYMRSWTALKDLFESMANFGKQNYPVLGVADSIISSPPPPSIDIVADSVSFNYDTARIFNNHTMRIESSFNQANKLYGIIGPSGIGKTTLISILGGQLKPQAGMVRINDTNIYGVNDAMRRQLIALQSQIATNLRGTVKYNLLFGLPENHPYTDEHLLELLQHVGLLTILAMHKGLETMLGEGGLNLSGGQRQRLNFASLYLRALFYKPALILIDEPTSSLDELSERAITQMIVDLSKNAVTLVIAHRLKTVEHAIALIDLSLLPQDNNIVPYVPSDLLKHSDYYCQLVEGSIQLDG